MAIAAASVSAHPTAARAIDPSLIPDLGTPNGGSGCPPSRQDFIDALTANVAAGHALTNPVVAITFPTDTSPASQRARLAAAAATLRNLFGPDDGCPPDATTLPAQLQALELAPRARIPSKPSKPAKPVKSASPGKPAAKSVARPGPVGPVRTKTRTVDPALRTSVPPRKGKDGKLRLPFFGARDVDGDA
ncbi:hypothetical protein TRAPUB_1290 [Trametes pubescens]|uniref:Uncharacterized protein n=1 Tax=Trametes pubescens TaxID=154538 RepID=A0A1M2VJR8_TRAPU|nr:hypothetical protein TRAPUB_1290 [Trametes pubescens]